MEQLDYWRLCDELSVVQAALLIVGADPTGSQEYIDQWDATQRPKGYDGALAALKAIVLSKAMKATIRRPPHGNSWLAARPHGTAILPGSGGMEVFCEVEPDWKITMISVSDLREFLKRRGIQTGFFFPQPEESVEYLDPNRPYFSPKLAAAVHAWQAVKSDPALVRTKRVKGALIVWLNQHAGQYGLTDKNGLPNETAIDEVAKVANWDTKGGAPKTP